MRFRFKLEVFFWFFFYFLGFFSPPPSKSGGGVCRVVVVVVVVWLSVTVAAALQSETLCDSRSRSLGRGHNRHEK